MLVSWNFRHIVNLQKIRGFNAVNLKAGYPMLEIRSPWEVVTYNKRELDAVKMMREIRDRLSKEFMCKTYKEQKRYIKEGLRHIL